MTNMIIEFKNSGFVDAVASSKLIKNKEEREFVREFLLNGFEVWENLLQGEEEFSTGVVYSFCDALFYDGVIQPSKNDLLTLSYFLDTVAVLAYDHDDFDAFIIQFGFYLREWFEENDRDIMTKKYLVRTSRVFHPVQAAEILQTWIECVKDSEYNDFSFLKMPLDWQLDLVLRESDNSSIEELLSNFESHTIKNDLTETYFRENILRKENDKNFDPIDVDFLYPYINNRETREALKGSHMLREKGFGYFTQDKQKTH